MRIKRFLSIVAASVPFFLGAAQQNPTFELWNKYDQPIYYALAGSDQVVLVGQFSELKPGKYVQLSPDITKTTILALSMGKTPVKGQKIDLFRMAPGKTIYVRVNYLPEKKIVEIAKRILGKRSFVMENYIFGSQTGPLLGMARGVTERGLPLKNNVTKDDMSYSSGVYQGR